MSIPRLTLLPAVAAIALASIAFIPGARAERHVACTTLPAAVLRQAKQVAPDAIVHGCVQDNENGKPTYEVKTIGKDGASKDITLDPAGSVIEVEQQVAASTLPTAVSDAIAKAARGNAVGKIESVTRAGVITSYETTISRSGHRREVAFDPQGAPVHPD